MKVMPKDVISTKTKQERGLPEIFFWGGGNISRLLELQVLAITHY